jgi:catechol 2,3-dioxygenase-like lactoylglutathione lyase family enzyme
MGFHHVALATARLGDTHEFYTQAMGFELVKVVVNPTPEGGWAKHAFYSTDDAGTGDPGMIAFWELHGEYPVVHGAMSGAVGLPDWVNHLAFHAVDQSHYDACLKRWLDLGLDVVEVDHEFCRSMYTNDPNGTMVEWCLDTRELDDSDRARAAEALVEADPGFDPPPADFVAHEGDEARRPAWARPS